MPGPTAVAPPQFNPQDFTPEAQCQKVNMYFTQIVAALNQLLGVGQSATTTTTQPNFADAETPSGAVNGTNKVFVLAHIPNPVKSLVFVADGVVRTDYTLLNGQVTLTGAAPATSVVAWYRY